MKLKAILQLLPENQIKSLGAGAKVESSYWHKPTPLEKAEAVLLSARRLETVVGGLDAECLRLLRVLAAQGGQERREALERSSAGAPQALRNLLDQHVCFAHERPPCQGRAAMIFLPDEFAQGIPQDAQELTTLGRLLNQQKSDYLGPLASRFGLDRGPKYRMVQGLKEKMLDKQTLDGALRQLSERERQVWEDCLDKGGVLDRADLRAQGVGYASFGLYGRDGNALNGLYLAGLLFPDREYEANAAFVPSDLMALRRQAPAVPDSWPAASAPARAVAWGDRLLADIRLLAAYAGSGRLPATQKGAPEKRSLAKFAEKLGVANPAYGLFLWGLLGPFLSRSPTGAVDVWGKDPSESLFGALDQALNSAQWFENYPWRHLDWGPRYFQDVSMPARRMHLLEVMAQAPEGWVEWKGLLSRLDSPMLRRADVLSQAASGGYAPEGQASWEAAAAAMVAETFLWCGWIELGFTSPAEKSSADTPFTHFRLTARGRAWAQARPRAAPAVVAPPLEEKFRILPNHEIQIPPRLEPKVLTDLFRVADLAGPATFALTKEGLRAALDADWTLERIIDFLKGHSSTGVPENVEIFLRDLGGKHGQIKIGYAGLFIEVTDPLLLVELKAQRALKDAIVKQVGDRLALISGDDPEALAKRLRKLGYFPVVEIEKDDLDFMIPWRLRRRY